MGIENLPEFIRTNYAIREWRHASAILENDFPDEWNEIIQVLSNFRLRKSEILQPGGGKSPIANQIDRHFRQFNWSEKGFATGIIVDRVERDSPTHKVDNFKNSIAVEVEWNNKDPFYDRDLNNFRLLFDLRVISVGVIITRCSELQEIFDKLEKGASYGASTTHWNKLIPRLEGGSGGGCPVLAFGISKGLYLDNE
ncbi:MAG: BglII/BstYI family type II restriction endonuclease [Anaerolineaceae bacterium]